MSESSDEAKFTLESVKITSESRGWKLDAWKFIPKGRVAPHPVIVMYAPLPETLICTHFLVPFIELGMKLSKC